MNNKKQRLVIRVHRWNDNHHLFNNRGTWWCSATVHNPDATKTRYRFSLKTRNVEKARRRRDKFFARASQELETVYV